MINELFLYDRNQGLFRKILDKSKVFEGRYHVSPNAGHDLNTNNLETYIKDPAIGLTDVKQKYPICVCMTPKSRIVSNMPQPMEEFTFTLYFLCRAHATGNNQIKNMDPDTNTSRSPAWYDWSDMKISALNFLDTFSKVIRKKSISNIPLRSLLNLDITGATITRLTKFNNDVLSGVGVIFNVCIAMDTCDNTEYEDIDSIEIPSHNLSPSK